MFTAACCFGGGFLIGAIGVSLHQLWLVYLGYGIIGGIGLGIGYVSPVSTLIKWFPDKHGMATGMAIMGFGGGAFIASPLSVALMNHFHTAASVGVAQTFVFLGVVYFISMNIGAFAIRIAAPGWKPDGWTPPATQNAMITKNHVHIDQALKTPQFWLVWWALCLNVTGGIGVIGQASVMIQESFKGAVTPAAAAGFVGLLSLFNMLGRFFWSSASDYIGRKNTYYIFLALGAVLYFLVPGMGAAGNLALFVLFYVIIISMYGGGFSTVPAYLADLFGTRYVGGIHGRRHLRAGADELHTPVPGGARRTALAGLHRHHAHHGGVADHRLHLQFLRAPRRIAPPHEQRRSGHGCPTGHGRKITGDSA